MKFKLSREVSGRESRGEDIGRNLISGLLTFVEGEGKSWGASGTHHNFVKLLRSGGEARRRAGHGGEVAAAFLPTPGKKRAGQGIGEG